ncbi:MAG: helix-turn-helix domain-containing protein [Thermodesulfobacteriota bacterium]
MGQLVLFESEAKPAKLDAYLACALTGLDKEKRQLMFHLSEIVADICAQYDISLYEPRKKTDPVHHKEVSDAEVFKTDRDRVLGSDLLIHLSHYPSTGSGQELDFAYNALLPIIIISHDENYVSRMITGIPSFTIHLKYVEPEDLRKGLHDCLSRIRSVLVERKLAFSKYNSNFVGQRIKEKRETLNLSREIIANSIPGMTEEVLKQLEENDDRTANPSLIQLRQLAVVLKTTVADLVEDNIEDRVVGTLNDWIEGKAAARFEGLSSKDSRKIIRRILLRLIDSLEED